MGIEKRTRRPTSLAARVTIFVGLATTTMFLLSAWSIEHSIERHFARMDLAELRAAWASVDAALRRDRASTPNPAQSQGLAEAIAGSHGVSIVVRHADGRLLYKTVTPDLDALVRRIPATANLNLDTLHIWRTSHHVYRGAVLRSGDQTVVVATAIDFHLQYLHKLQNALWAGTLIANLISVLVAGLAVRQGHAPLRRISARMREMTTERLHTRLDPAHVPIELADLVAAFNAMLTRIEQGFVRLRHVSADIAHELRTPVTNLRTQTQVALSKARDVDAYREILYSNLEEFEHMSAMIGDMLFLAQAEQSSVRRDASGIDLNAEICGLFDYFEAWAEDRGVRLELGGQAGKVDGDREMLRRALSNLIANAIRYTQHGQSVHVRLSQDERWVRIEICNPGIGIPSEHLPHLFDRFYRVDPSRQRRGEGAGLGLAIVKSIVEAHAGQVEVTSENGKTCFSVRLPGAHLS
ncbi:MAG: Cu(+)/Ag(+) sensor histidine kinase [Betaproteobacteria bacterium]|nr:Cu(+)/Ag(+) sensor histidine kinase [Betaproteobacteria bacterium]MDE2270062.1 Cu(+)/Ag(+) sensor histidine kinase [Betaproteobacteria bacterium]